LTCIATGSRWISAEELRKLTKNYRLGLGTFVDKTTMPYVSLEEYVSLGVVVVSSE